MAVTMNFIYAIVIIYVFHGTSSRIIYETNQDWNRYGNGSYNCGKCVCTANKYGTLSADCSNRNLTDIPTNLPLSTTNLNLNGNRLLVLKTDCFKHLPKLVKLDLSLNVINEIEKGAFSGLRSLEVLSLEGNNLELSPETYKFDSFSDLKKLKVLKINNNTVSDSSSYPDDAFQALAELQYFSLDGLPNTDFGIGFQKLKQLKTLHMSGYIGKCYIRNITRHTFASFEFIENLNLTNCGIQHVERWSIRHMSNIRVIDISNNEDMGLDNMANLCYGIYKSIKQVHANSLYPLLSLGTMLTRQHSDSMLNSSLEELHLDANRIQLMEIGVLSSLPKTLKYVSLKANIILYGPYCLELSTLTGLQTLDMSYLYHSLPQPGRRRRRHLEQQNGVVRHFDKESKPSPESQQVIFSDSKIKPLGRFSYPIPRNLKTLIYHQSKLRYYIPELFLDYLTLENLDLSDNTLYEWRGPIHANGSEHLLYLNLASNSCYKVSDVFFNALTGLKTLIIQNNLLGINLKRDLDGKIFKALKNLQTLDLSQNRLELLPNAIFKGLNSLENLNVSNNFLLSWEPDMGHMEHISIIDLSFNQLKRFSKTTMNTLNKISSVTNVTVNLSRNAIECSCYTTDFLEWLLNSKVHVILKKDDYCIFQNQTRSSLTRLPVIFKELQKECRSYVFIIVLTSALIALVITIIVGAIVYRNRWKLRYLYYMARLKFRRYNVLHDDNIAENKYMYDAFVSYAEDDRDFVEGEILERLEKQNNLKLCVHQRDFRIGESIPGNIMQAINDSKKILVIMSNEFINSYWCRFELQLANIENLQSGRNFICMVLKEDKTTIKDPPLEIVAYLKSNSYIEYPTGRNQDNIEMFWERLLTALKEE